MSFVTDLLQRLSNGDSGDDEAPTARPAIAPGKALSRATKDREIQQDEAVKLDRKLQETNNQGRSSQRASDDSPYLIARKRKVNDVIRNQQRGRWLYVDDTPTASDELGLAPTADLLSTLLVSPQTQTPFALGIDGAWGSGKTSLCKRIEAGLQNMPGVVTCWVNAARYDSTSQLAAEFMVVLDKAANSDGLAPDERQEYERCYAALDARAHTSSESQWTDVGTEDLIQNLGLALFSLENASDHRIVVFVDDLDRCTPKQLASALLFLRPLIIAQGMVVVLPCDRSLVLSLLGETIHGAQSEDRLGAFTEQQTTVAYLERYVRLWVTIPTPTRENIRVFLAKLLTRKDDDDSQQAPQVTSPDNAKYIEIAALLVDGNPRRLKNMTSAYRLTRQFYDSQDPQHMRARSFDLFFYDELLLKLFLLRHFFAKRFDQFREMPKSYILVQTAAQAVESSGADPQQKLLEDYPTIRKWLEDAAFRRLMICQPLLTVRQQDSNENWVPPILDMMSAALLCPPSEFKAPSDVERVRAVAVEDDFKVIQEEAVGKWVPKYFLLLPVRPSASAANPLPQPEIISQSSSPASKQGKREAEEPPQGPILVPGMFSQAQANAQANGLGGAANAANAADATDAADSDTDDDDAQAADDAGGADNDNSPNGRLVKAQEIWLLARMARQQQNRPMLRRLGEETRALVRRTSADVRAGTFDVQASSNLVGIIGNIGVVFETSGEYALAEEIYRGGIEINPQYAGIRVQYADFLIDRSRAEDAKAEIDRARALSPDDERIPSVDAKIQFQLTPDDPALRERLKQMFYKEPTRRSIALLYLRSLSRVKDGSVVAEYERACQAWEAALPEEDKTDAPRALADYYATHGRREDAIALYKRLLERNMDSEDRSAALHNLATSEAIIDDRENSYKHWVEAYQLAPHDDQLRAAFVSALMEWGRNDDALRVSRGLPLEDSW